MRHTPRMSERSWKVAEGAAWVVYVGMLVFIAMCTLEHRAAAIAAADWLESRSWLASWLQAFGAVAAILLAVYLQSLAIAQGRQDRQIDRIQRHEDALVNRIRATNSAISLAGVACNLAIALRNQHSRAALAALRRLQKEQAEWATQRNTGQRQGNAPLALAPDLTSFHPPAFPFEMLRDLVVTKSLPHGRAIAATLAVEQACLSLQASMARRDVLAQQYASGQIPKAVQAYHILGVPLPDGGINREYPDLVNLIDECAADMAFFAAQLCEDLIQHGEQLKAVLTQGSRHDAPKIVTIDFTEPRRNELIPPAANYEAWLRGFSFAGERRPDT